MKLTDKVSGWCNQRGHNKAEVAEAIGVSTNTLTSRLANKTGWTWSEACKLAVLMGCSLDELIEQ